jgi:hypothetical protein
MIWAASEVRRPGSVWAHTLLLRQDAIAELRGAGGILNAFVRPTAENDLQKYREPKQVRDMHQSVGGVERELAEAVLLAAYGWPGRPTGVITEELQAAPKVLLAVWQRQWPELRQSFVFRTRQRLSDQIGGGMEVARRPSRNPDSQGRVVLESGSEQVLMAPAWVDSLTQDLCSDTGELDQFLWLYGPEAPHKGFDVPVLTRLYSDVSRNEEPERLLAYLTSIFESPREMGQLKRDLLGASSGLWKLDEHDRLQLCVLHAQSIPWNDLAVPSRLRLLLQQRPVDAVHILLSADQKSPEGQELLAAIAGEVDADLIIHVAGLAPEIAAELLSVNPAPLSDPDLWVKAGARGDHLLDALARVSLQIPIHPFIDVAEGKAVNKAIRAGIVSLRETMVTVGSDATEAALDRWSEVFRGLVRETQRELKAEVDAQWQAVALALAAAGTPDQMLVRRHALELAENFEAMGEVVRLRVAAAIFSMGGKQVVEHRATARSFATLHKAPAKELRRADVSEILSVLSTKEKPRPVLREELVRIVVEEDWNERDIAWALHDAGPGARKVKDYTPKKSELRKAFNASWKMAAKGVDFAIRKLGG